MAEANGVGNGKADAGQVKPLKLEAATAVFPTIIESYEVTEHEPLNRWLMEEIAKWRKAEPGQSRSNAGGGWHSSGTLFSREEPAFREVSRRIAMALTHAARRFQPDFDIVKQRARLEGWVNVNEKGSYNMPHAHYNAHLSGVYYVAIPETQSERSGAIDFHSPLGAINPLGHFGQRITPSNHLIRPRAGLLLIFPSYLRHFVCPSEEDELRVSIAFNMTVPDTPGGRPNTD